MANPFLAPSTLPYELPAFADIRAEEYLPAFEAGFTEQLAEIEDIAANPEPASFANTMVALERSGGTLQRVAAVLRNIASADATEEIRQLEQAVSPRLAAHQDNVYLHPGLYRRIMAGQLEGLEYHENPIRCRDGRLRLAALPPVSGRTRSGRIVLAACRAATPSATAASMSATTVVRRSSMAWRRSASMRSSSA